MRRKLKWFDWLIILIFLILSVIPDPTDAFDFGTPLLEIIMAFSYWYIRMRGLKI